MTITAFSLQRESIPLQSPFVTALRRVDTADFVVLTLSDGEGNVGVGSAPATKAITGETLQSIESALTHAILPALLNRRSRLSILVQIIQNSIAGHFSAKAACDMALYDLTARRRGMSLWKLFGARGKRPLQTVVTISLDTPERMAESAANRYAEGCSRLKVKLGGKDHLDVERIARIRHALPRAVLLIDANQAWKADEAIRQIEAMEPYRVTLVEQPVLGDDFQSLLKVTQASEIPILADEAVFSFRDAERIIAHEAADMINIKLMKCGGITPALQILELCRRHTMPVMLGSMLEGPVSIVHAMHLATAYGDVIRWLDLDSPLLYHRDAPRDRVRVEGNVLIFGD